MEPEVKRAFTRFIKLLIELTRTSFLQTSNELEHVHLLVIKLEHPIFGFERLNIIRSITNYNGFLLILVGKLYHPNGHLDKKNLFRKEPTFSSSFVAFV